MQAAKIGLFLNCDSAVVGYGLGMASGTSTDNVDDLKRQLHDEIERLPRPQLEAVKRFVLLFEVMEAAEQIDREFDADHAAGLLTPEKIDQAVRDARAALRSA
jgi:hypothetical protein